MALIKNFLKKGKKKKVFLNTSWYAESCMQHCISTLILLHKKGAGNTTSTASLRRNKHKSAAERSVCLGERKVAARELPLCSQVRGGKEHQVCFHGLDAAEKCHS